MIPMNKLFAGAIPAIAAIALLVSCGKDEPSNNHAEGNEDKAVTSITLRSSTMDMDLSWTEGRVLDGIVCNPEDTPLSSLRCRSSDESVVTVKKDPYGFRVFPHKIGEATLTIVPSDGPASATCTVRVNEDGLSDAPEISSIELETTDGNSVVSDYNNRTAVFTAKFTPAGISTKDIVIYSDRPDLIEKISYIGIDNKDGTYGAIDVDGKGVLMVGITVKRNTAHAKTETGIVNVYVKPRKGPAKTQIFKLDVRGHIYKLEFPALATDSDNIKGGEVYLSRGESVKLEPKIYTTGELMDSDGLYWTSLDAAGLQVSEDFVMTFPDGSSGMVYNNGISVYCGDNNNSMPNRLGVKVHTFDKPSGINFSGIDASKTYYAGDKVSFTAAVSPSTARQDVKVLASGSPYVTLTQGEGSAANKFTAEFVRGSSKDVSIRINPVGTTLGSSLQLKVYDYHSTDLKPGDYVYHNPDNSAFWTSDGGLRVHGHGEVLDNPVTPDKSRLVGVVYDMDVKADAFPVRLCGLANGGHCAFVAIKDAGKQIWSSDSDGDIASVWSKQGYGTAPNDVPGSASQVYNWNIGWLKYNDYRGASHRVKAMYPLKDYELLSPISTAILITQGSSGWLLMGRKDADAILGDISIIQERMRLAGGDLITDAWTCQYLTNENKYSYGLSVKDGKCVKKRRNVEYSVRPIAYL